MHPLTATGAAIADEADLVALLAGDAPDIDGTRSWVTTNMVMTLDGAYADQGRSGGISSDADHRLFIANRSLADAILVGASTARAERYRRPRVGEAAAEVRRLRGQEPEPRVVMTSRRLGLPPDLGLLDGRDPRPILAHPLDVDTSGAPEGVELLAVGQGSVDFSELLGRLARRGMRRIVCEGGPGILGQLAEADLIDEFLLTLSPRLVGGDDVGLLSGARPDAATFALHRAHVAEDHLMLAYRRTRRER